MITESGNTKLIGAFLELIDFLSGAANYHPPNTSIRTVGRILARSFVALFVMAAFGTCLVTAQTSLVTAVRDGSDKLKLISWNENGDRLNRDGAQADEVRDISATRLGTDRMVTAVRDGGGNLKVIAWAVPDDGQIALLGSSQAGEVSRISVAANPDGTRVVTAVRDGGGKLKLISWAVTPGGEVNRLGFEQAGEVDDIEATYVGSTGTLLATAVRDGSGKLTIITWRVATFGCIRRLDDVTAGKISEVAMTVHGENGLVTAVRDGGGNLKLIAWNVDQAGIITRLSDEQTGQAGTATRIAAFPLFGSQLMTAVRDGSDDLKVIAWEANNLNARLDDEGAGHVNLIAGCSFAPGVGAPEPEIIKFQTSVQAAGGNLKIIPWEWNRTTNAIRRLSEEGFNAGEVSLISTVCF